MEEQKYTETKNEDGTTTISAVKEKPARGQTSIDMTLEPEPPRNMSVKLNDLIDRSAYLNRMSEKGIINEKTGSSVVVRDDGQINLSASKGAQYKLNPGGRASEITQESKTVTNRKILDADDIIINGHKLNSDLWQYTDFKEISLPYTEKAIVGGLTLHSHILVKAWEPNLKRYMLIRRPARIRMFSPLLNMPEINNALGINDPLKIDEDILALTQDGYQVNSLIKDAKSIIGKEGSNRFNSWSDEDTMTSAGGSGGGSVGNADIGSYGNAELPPEKCYEALKKLGYTKVAICGIMGNIGQESSFKPTSGRGERAAACGLCQWGNNIDGSRWQTFLRSVPEPDCWDGGKQLAWIVNEPGYDSCKPGAKIDQCSTPEEAAAVFCWEYEGPDPAYANLSRRQSLARQFYNKFN